MPRIPNTASRTLRSKRLRAALWYAAEGRCQMCGRELGDNWHADHIIPWSHTHRTNVHEMQALCAECNLKKGSTLHGIKMDKLRRFQREIVRVGEEIAARRPIRTILAHVTPGGGKSVLPVLLQHVMNPNAYAEGHPPKNGGVEYHLLWVVPRDSLRSQGEREVYSDRFFRNIVPHQLMIRASGNDSDPCREFAGCVTTYQAIAAAPQLWADEFTRPNRKYILVLDEFHHVELDGRTHQSLKPLWERAAIRLLMTGTMERGDNSRIAFLPYREVAKNRYVTDADNESGWRVIRYTRGEAITDQAILSAEFRPQDAKLEYIDRYGDHRVVVGFEQARSDASDALYVALNTEYAVQVLNRCADDWDLWRKVNPNAKLLVVVSTQRQAKELTAHLTGRYGRRVNIAISDDSEEAKKNIAKFKVPHNGKGERLDVLVTVGMAYEGMDVKGISHIAMLTRIRSKPWIEQCIARAVRVDKVEDCGLVYDEQLARVFAPDDLLFREVMEMIRREQEEPARERNHHDSDDGDEPTPDASEPGAATPLAGMVINESAWGFNGIRVNGSELSRYEGVCEEIGIPKAYALKVREAVELVKRRDLEREVGIEDYLATEAVDDAPLTTPSEREKVLRRRIANKINRWDHLAGHDPGEGNRIAIRKFGKQRKDMTETELLELLRWVNDRLSDYAEDDDDDDA